MNWYYARGDERMGPVDDREIVALAATGQIGAQTLVWREGMADWTPWGRAPRPAGGDPADDGSSVALAAADTFGYQACAECGRTFPAEEMVAYENLLVCGECKPVFFQRLREGGLVYRSLNYAGFWIRVCASLVDSAIMLFFNSLVTLLQIYLMGGFQEYISGETSATDIGIAIVFWLLNVAAGLTYETWFVGRFAATPGKMLLGLRVVRSDGSPVTYRRAMGRFFASWLSQMTLGIGYVIAAFDDQKRTLHDHICDTRVIHQ